MRRLPLGPIALSLAVHGCALMLVAPLALQRSRPPPHRELTIGLAMLPRLGQTLEPRPAAGAAPATVPDVPPAAEAVPESPPAEARSSDPVASRPVDATAAPPAAMVAAVQASAALPALLASAPASAVPTVSAGVPETVGSADTVAAIEAPGPVQAAGEAPLLEVSPPAAVDAAPAAPGAAPDRPGPEPQRSEPATTTPAVPVAAAAAPPPDLTAAHLAEAPPAAPSSDPAVPAAGPPDLASAFPGEAMAADARPAELLPASPAAPALALAEPALAGTEEPRQDSGPDVTDAIAQASRFIARYEGGPCVDVAATRLAGGVAEVDGFSASTAPFGAFHQAFAAAAGFEPLLTGQRIWSPQCAAVDALHRLHVGGSPAPVLRLDAVAVAGGSAVRGTLADPAHRPLRLLLVSEDGAVADVSGAIGLSGDPTRFVLPMPTGRRGGPVPRMLFATAGAIPPAASVLAPPEATAYFAALAATARSPAPPGAAGKLFLLGD